MLILSNTYCTLSPYTYSGQLISRRFGTLRKTYKKAKEKKKSRKEWKVYILFTLLNGYAYIIVKFSCEKNRPAAGGQSSRRQVTKHKTHIIFCFIFCFICTPSSTNLLVIIFILIIFIATTHYRIDNMVQYQQLG
jgi:hypothetical protein